MSSEPKHGQSFSDWFHGYLQLIQECERAREKRLDDDIKCACALKRAPKELRDDPVLSTESIADDFAAMTEVVQAWMRMNAMFSRPGTPALGVGYVGHDDGKGKGKGYGSYQQPWHQPWQQPWQPSWQSPSWSSKGGKFAGKQQGKDGKSSFGGYSKGKGSSKFGGGKGYFDSSKGKGKSKSKSVGKQSKSDGQFQGFCGSCWEWGHKRSHCPKKSTSVAGLISDTASNASTFGPSASCAPTMQIGAIRADLQQDDEEDWPWDPYAEWYEDLHEDHCWDVSEDYSECWQEDAWVCAVSASSSKDELLVEEIMIDSGSQSNATMPSFASEYTIDDSNVARL